jgi:hypothetical protein
MSFVSTTEGVSNIDLYDTPIDLRPVPKLNVIDACIEHLRANRDYYGVELLELAKVRGDVKDIE